MTKLLTKPLSVSSLFINAASLEGVEGVMRDVIAANLTGFLRAIVESHMESGGKRLRARLALTSAEALGVEGADAVRWAAACELLHNATLVHDDLQDQDRLRRGHPTLWARHGAAQAINAGDALLVLPFALLGESRAVSGLCGCLARRALEAANGQSLEMTLGKEAEASWENYLRMAAGKSGQLFALPLEGAALLSGMSVGEARALSEASVLLGVLYQVLDDVLDLYPAESDLDHAPEERRGGDVREGKATALVTYRLKHRPETRDEMLALLSRPAEETSAREVEAFAQEMIADGTLEGVCREGLAMIEALRVDEALRKHPRLHEIVLGLAEGLGLSLSAIEARLA